MVSKEYKYKPKFYFGEYMPADPKWNSEFAKWIFKSLAPTIPCQINRILQREDQLGFKIKIRIKNRIDITITFHCQENDPFEGKKSAYIVILAIPISLKNFQEIFFVQDNHPSPPNTGYKELKEGKLVENAMNPLVKILDSNPEMTTARFQFKKSLDVYNFYNRDQFYQITDSLYILNNFVKSEANTMQYEEFCYATLTLTKKKTRQKKKIKFNFNTSSFFGLLNIALNNYYRIQANLVELQAEFDKIHNKTVILN